MSQIKEFEKKYALAIQECVNHILEENNSVDLNEQLFVLTCVNKILKTLSLNLDTNILSILQKMIMNSMES